MNQHKNVFITGSSRGIGKAAALRYAREGYNIIINCISNEEMLTELRHKIEYLGCDCLALRGDVGDYYQSRAMYKKIEEKFGGIDILINNAGISHTGLLSDMDIGSWEQIIRTNLTSVFNCSKLAIPYMVQQKQGKIINISSVWGVRGASCETAYSASKGGVNAFTKALAKELAPSNIQVNAIACGAIDTEMNHQLTKEERTVIEEEIPAGRFASAEETAEFIYQLSTSYDYMTGQIISFDGGWQ